MNSLGFEKKMSDGSWAEVEFPVEKNGVCHIPAGVYMFADLPVPSDVILIGSGDPLLKSIEAGAIFGPTARRMKNRTEPFWANDWRKAK